jgi:hypothetical protein
MIEFRVCPVETLPDTEMVEVYRDGVLIAGIYSGDGDEHDFEILSRVGHRFVSSRRGALRYKYQKILVKVVKE